MTAREAATLAHHPNPVLNPSLSGVFGGRQQSYVLLRAVVLMVLRRRADGLRRQCRELLPGGYTADEEVTETLKVRLLAPA